MVKVAYIDLTPGIDNLHSDACHKALVEALNRHPAMWDGRPWGRDGYVAGLFVATKGGVTELHVKGPTFFKKSTIVDYVIYLPSQVDGRSHYLDLVFAGVGMICGEAAAPHVRAAREECDRLLRDAT